MNKSPVHYVLTVEQMIENDYPVPSYLADVFEKPPEWIEIAQQQEVDDESLPAIYAVDCEMVSSFLNIVFYLELNWL
jgi:RNA exonuclease 1